MSGINLDLDNLRTYAHEITQALENHTQSFINEIDANAKQMSKKDRDELYEWHSDTHWQLNDVFPKIINYSLFVASYSYLESALASIVKKLEKDNPKPIKLKDLCGDSNIQRFKIYLKKVQEIDFPDNSSEWQSINTYRRIRNFIVHNDSTLDDSNNANIIRQFAFQYPQFISINQFNKVSIARDGNIDFIDIIEKFLTNILDNIS
jgi:hypothetical protein